MVVPIGTIRNTGINGVKERKVTVMKLYECIVDDGKNVFKVLTAAKNKKELLNVYGGNGTFEKITDVTKEYFTSESPELLNGHLEKMGWGEGERKIICTLLEEHIIRNIYKGK